MLNLRKSSVFNMRVCTCTIFFFKTHAREITVLNPDPDLRNVGFLPTISKFYAVYSTD